jgi:hypothetical protein
MKIESLIEAASKLKPAPSAAFQDVLIAAKQGELGLHLAEYPSYRLKRSARTEKLPPGKYLRSAVVALRQSGRAMSLEEIVAQYHYGVPKSPETWMYLSLERDGGPFVMRTGRLRVGLRRDAVGRQAPALRALTPKDASKRSREPIGHGIDEKNLETLLVNRLDLLEPGLTFIKRQFSVGVGVLDLLCLDRKRNLVVVEIKRPRSDSRAVVGQISSYMGWVRRHMAGPGQLVRGIIVVGREDVDLSEFAHSTRRSRRADHGHASGGGSPAEVVIERGKRQSLANCQFEVGGVVGAEFVRPRQR